MAEFVGLQTQSPDVLQRMSALLGIKSQQQALAGQAAEVKSAEQSQRQREALSKFKFDTFLDEEGLPDVASLSQSPELRAAAGDQYLDILSKAAGAREQQITNRRSLVGLRNDQREAFASLMGGLRGDPDVAADTETGRQKINQAMIEYGEMYGADALPVLATYANAIKNTRKGGLSSALKAIQLQAVSAGNQIDRQGPEYLNTGGKAVNINPNMVPGSAPGEVAMTVSPGISTFTDASGRPFAFNQQNPGRVMPVGGGGVPAGTPGPAAAPSAPPSAPGPRFYRYPGEDRDIESFQTEAQNVRQAADAGAQAAGINQQILRLSRDTTTGPGTQWWQDKIGGALAPLGLSPTANHQELGKFLEKNAIAAMQAMGGAGSDARLEAAVKANGSTAFSPEALQAVTKYNDATTTALMQFRNGMEHAIGSGQGTDYTKMRDFKSQWAKNFDVNIFRVENAIRDGDQKELAKIRSELGPDGLKSLVAKRKRLLELSGAQ
jgi:hypothetical protein